MTLGRSRSLTLTQIGLNIRRVTSQCRSSRLSSSRSRCSPLTDGADEYLQLTNLLACVMRTTSQAAKA